MLDSTGPIAGGVAGVVRHVAGAQPRLVANRLSPLMSQRSDPIPLRPLTRIAVVGGGALGLAALEQLIEGGVPREAIVCFEGRSDVGGLWCVFAFTSSCKGP